MSRFEGFGQRRVREFSGKQRNPGRVSKTSRSRAGDERQGDDPHGLLRVVGAVGETHVSGAEQLEFSKDAINGDWTPAPQQKIKHALMTMNPTTNWMSGELIMGTMTFQRIPLPCHQWSLPGMDQMMEDHRLLDAASTAPQSPPTSACDELEGRPNHHVSRLQRMAADQRTAEHRAWWPPGRPPGRTRWWWRRRFRKRHR